MLPPIAELKAFIQPICEAAGRAILPHFARVQHLAVNHKADDSPVTAADIDAHHKIAKGLSELPWQLPLVSEEDWPVAFTERQTWPSYWLVDPLDGTREFLAGSPEFSVNIALIQGHQAVWGAIYQPVTNAFYWGGAEFGAWGPEGPLKAASLTACAQGVRALKVITSKRHGLAALSRWAAEFERNHPHIDSVAVGSSLKFCTIAQGQADIYPRFGATAEWDTAAGQAILEGAGGQVLDAHGAPLRYNTKADILNPEFVALGSDATEFLDTHVPHCILNALTEPSAPTP